MISKKFTWLRKPGRTDCCPAVRSAPRTAEPRTRDAAGISRPPEPRKNDSKILRKILLCYVCKSPASLILVAPMSIVVLLATLLAGWEAAVATWESCLPGQEMLEAASHATPPRQLKRESHISCLHTSTATWTRSGRGSFMHHSLRQARRDRAAATWISCYLDKSW